MEGRRVSSRGLCLAVVACAYWAIPSCGGNSVETRKLGPDRGGSASGGAEAGESSGGTTPGGGAPMGGDAGQPPSTGGTASGSGGTGGEPAGAGGGSGAGDGGEPPLPACGATRDCIGSFLHRSSGEPCTLPTRDTMPSVRDPDCDPNDDHCSVEQHFCDTDLDCTSDSYCTFERQDGIDGYLTWIYIRCTRPCQTDAECDEGNICLCNGVTKNATREVVSMGVCTQAECNAAGCADGYQCISPIARRRVQPFHCQSPEDECWGPEDCPGPPPGDRCDSFETCSFDGYFRCGFGSDSEEKGCEFAP